MYPLGVAEFRRKFQGDSSFLGLGQERPSLELSFKEDAAFWLWARPNLQFSSGIKEFVKYVARPGKA